MNVDNYVGEALEGVAEANLVHGTSLELEEIVITPNDYATKGQVLFCSKKIASHFAMESLMAARISQEQEAPAANETKPSNLLASTRHS